MFFKIEKFDDIHVIKASKTLFDRPVFFVHAFCLDRLLIDTCFCDSKTYMRRFMEDYRVQGVVITHHHEDHIGANAEANRIGITPLVPAEGRVLIEHPHTHQLYRRLLWGTPAASRADVLGNNVITDHFNFEVIHAPGHSHDHKVFYVRERGLLFTGDVFLAEKIKYMRDDEDAVVTMETLRTLLKLDFEVMFDALRGPIENAKPALKRKLEFLETRQAMVQSLYRKGMSLRAITTQVFGREDFMTVVSRGHFSKINITKSLLGITNYPLST